MDDPAIGHPDVDVAVLGAGSGGARVAALAASAGLSVAVVEQRLVGGECPYYACIPSKAMLRTAALRSSIGRAAEIGAAAERLDAGDPDTAWAVAAARRDAAASHRDDADHVASLADAGITLIRARGTIEAPGRLRTDHGATLGYRHLVLATGAAPVIPPLEGIDDVAPWTFEEAWSTTRRPGSLLVLGGGAVGLEIAQTYARFGSDVTLVEQEAIGAGGIDPEVAEDLAGVLRADGVDVRLGVAVQAVRPDGDRVVAVLDDDVEVTVDRLVLAAGKRPRLDGIGLEQLGLDADDGLSVDDRLAVLDPRGRPLDGVWAVGDVTGIAPFTHTANHQAEVIADAIGGGRRRADHGAIPRTIYTEPEAAAVGLTRQQAQDAGHDVAVAVMDLGDTARGSVDIATAGQAVLVADRGSRRLLGASLLAPAASALIGELTLAVKLGVTVDVLAELVRPFPSWAEGLTPAMADLRDALDRGDGGDGGAEG